MRIWCRRASQPPHTVAMGKGHLEPLALCLFAGSISPGGLTAGRAAESATTSTAIWRYRYAPRFTRFTPARAGHAQALGGWPGRMR